MPILVALVLGLGALILWKRPGMRSVIFLVGVVAGLLCTWLGFVFYLVKHNYYANIVHNLLYIPKGLWSFIFTVNISKDVYIMLMIFGMVLFVSCMLCYALSYTQILYYRLYRFRAWILYAFFGLLWAAEFIIFLPDSYRALAAVPAWQEALSNLISRWGAAAFKGFNIFCLIAALLILLWDYISQRKVVAHSQTLLYHFLILLFLVGTYLVLFSWMPALLLRPSLIAGYYIYTIPDVTYMIPLVNVFPVISMVFSTMIFYFTYKYRLAISASRNIEISFDRSMQVASQSMRVYAHSMKNQLTAIQAEVEYLETFPLEKEAIYSLGLIRESCCSALETIDTGSEVLQRRHVRLKQTLADVPLKAALEEQKLLAKDVHISVLYPPSIPAAYLDEVQIKDVLCNLIANAVDAIVMSKHPAEGEIVIRVHDHAKWVIFTVEDNGCGMVPEVSKQIFEPFYSTKSSSTNWGMGLSLCQKIMAAHHGSITVESVPDVGSKFDLVLPGS